MTCTMPTNLIGLTRVAQSVLHAEIADREQADSLSHRVIDYILRHWGEVAARFGGGGADDFEIVERATRHMLHDRTWMIT